MKKKSEKVKSADEQKIIVGMKRGKKNAYCQMVEIYQKKLFSYVYRLTGNKEESEDIVQNVFVKMHRGIKTFDETKRFSPWIYRIAHNETVNFIKKRGKKKNISWENIELEENKLIRMRNDEQNPIEEWMKKESTITVRKAIKKLPVKYRKILTERYFLDKSYEEISIKIGSPVNTVGTIINRAKKRLLSIIKKDVR